MSTLRKDETGFGIVAILLAIVVVAFIGGAGYFVYQSHHKATTSVATTTTTTTKPNTTTPTSMYAGWLTASLKYEKLSVKYPSSWKISNTSTPTGTGDTVTPGRDDVILTSPSGLVVTINTGLNNFGGGPYYGTILSATPITSMGASYYLGFGTNAPGDTSATTTSQGCVGTLPTNASFPYSKNITVISGTNKAFNAVCITYARQNNGDTTQKSVAAFHADPSFNDARLVIQSLTY